MGVPGDVSACLVEARSALTALELAVQSLCLAADPEATARHQRAAEEAEGKVERLETEMDRKREKIAYLLLQVSDLEATAKQKDEDIKRLEDAVGKMKSERIAAGTARAAALSLSRERGRTKSRRSTSPSRSRSRKPRSRGRRGRRAKRRPKRSPSNGGSGARQASSSRSSSGRSSSAGRRSDRRGGAEGDLGSWVDRRRNVDGKSADTALCIPFLVGRCKAGEDCPQRHPSDSAVREARATLQRKVCRFGAQCHRAGCIFRHEGAKPEKESCRATPCRYGSSCKRPDCKFLHTWNNKPGGDADVEGASASEAKPPCRNGPDCKRQDCPFSHP